MIDVRENRANTTDFSQNVWRPNITGYHRSVINAGGDDGSTGVFYFDSEQSSRAAITDTGTTGLTRFNAQRGSGIFKDGSTVQPPALKVLSCIRC